MGKIYKKGELIHGFKVLRVVDIKEIKSKFIELEHQKSGAKYIHLENDSAENVFCIGFKTIPFDSTGVAHILEHTVLTGSEKYPVRDPFFYMYKRSMKTFMNAFTSADWTAYPFSTQNEKDYFNLMNVYLDAVFKPTISKLNFMQEGWRYEFEGNDLVYKGVVYNEMKGSMSSTDRLIEQNLYTTIFPTLTYGNNAGGEPKDIPNLTHEQLVSFHKRFYHPSNSYIYSYGNISLEKNLEFVDTHYLKSYDKIDPKTDVGKEKRFKSLQTKTYKYPVLADEDIDKKYQVTIGWLLCGLENVEDVTALVILEEILIGNPGSPLKKALLDAEIGTDLSSDSGLEDEFREVVFSCGIKDIEKKNIAKAQKIIEDTLKDLVKNGVDKNYIESAINQVEFRHKEVTNSPYPFGLKLWLRFFNLWQHDLEPLDNIVIDKHIKKIKKQIKDKYFEKLIKKYFIDNNHKVKVILEPDENMREREEKKLKDKLDKIKSKMSQTEKKEIKENAKALLEYQSMKEDENCLPSLNISDIPKRIKDIAPDKNTKSLFVFDQPTNGIFYYNAYLDIKNFRRENFQYLPLFCYLLSKIGTDRLNYEELAQAVEKNTGGIGFSVSASNKLNQKIDKELYVLSLHGKCVNEKQDKLFSIINEIIDSVNFGNIKALRKFILEYSAKFESEIVSNGTQYALKLACADFTTEKKHSERWYGVTQLKFIRDLTKDLSEEKLHKLAVIFQSIKEEIFKDKKLISCIIGDHERLERGKTEIQKIDSSKNTKNVDLNNVVKLKKSENAFEISADVAFVASVFETIDFTHKDSAILYVISKLLRLNYVHKEVREKGGAYGGNSDYNFYDGLFIFTSYRDPNIYNTIKVFEKAKNYLKSNKYSDQDIQDSIIQACAEYDKPYSPHEEAELVFNRSVRGITPQMRQDFKNNILKVNRKKIDQACEKYFSIKSSDLRSAVIASDKMIKKANKELGKEKFRYM